MIARIWHGYTLPETAGIYEQLLKEEIFIGIENMRIAGFHKIHLLKRELENEIEFTTIMWFDDLESVKEFAGEDYEKAYVPEKARAILSRFDQRSAHYELIHELSS